MSPISAVWSTIHFSELALCAFHFLALATKVYEVGLVQNMSERADEIPAPSYFLSYANLSNGALG